MVCAATLQDNGAEGTGTFSDGTTFSATNSGTYISVNVDNGACIGDYYVSHEPSECFFCVYVEAIQARMLAALSHTL